MFTFTCSEFFSLSISSLIVEASNTNFGFDQTLLRIKPESIISWAASQVNQSNLSLLHSLKYAKACSELAGPRSCYCNACTYQSFFRKNCVRFWLARDLNLIPNTPETNALPLGQLAGSSTSTCTESLERLNIFFLQPSTNRSISIICPGSCITSSCFVECDR